MSTASQFYQLQEIEIEIEYREEALAGITAQLADDLALVRAQNNFKQAENNIKELRKKQRLNNLELSALSEKVSTTEKELYSGRTANPKELVNLQHEIDGLKSKLNDLESETLETMEVIDRAASAVTGRKHDLEKITSEWQRRKEELSKELRDLEAELADLRKQREMTITGITPQSLQRYYQLKKKCGQAVARVERGICFGCRISLPSMELQRARGNHLVECSSCGRFLFLP